MRFLIGLLLGFGAGFAVGMLKTQPAEAPGVGPERAAPAWSSGEAAGGPAGEQA